jgi:putative DNA primase/helicase
MLVAIAGLGVLPRPESPPVFPGAALNTEVAAATSTVSAVTAPEPEPTISAASNHVPIAASPALQRTWPANAADTIASASVDEFLTAQFAPREMVLAPILPSQGLTMLYSRRGVGKTYLTLAMAHAVARGGSFLRWSAPRPRRVLFVDGELPAPVLQQRLRAIVSGLPASEPPLPKSDSLKIITPDLQRSAMPDISTTRGQEMIEARLDGDDLLVLDNLSCLARSGKENEGESWIPVQDWALRLRQQGISVLFLHHAGKGGQQRGTSRREDLLDTVIALRQPDDYCATQGLRAEIRFEKARGFFGEDARPFEVHMEIQDGAAVWSITGEKDKSISAQVFELFEEGLSVREVAERLSLSKSRVGRLREAWDSHQSG